MPTSAHSHKERIYITSKAGPARGSGEIVRLARDSKDFETAALCLFPKEAGGTTAQLDYRSVLGSRDRRRGRGRGRGRKRGRCAGGTSPRRGRTSYQRIGSLATGVEPKP